MAESNVEILDRVINRDYPKCDVLYSWQAIKKELSGSGQNSAELTKVMELVKPIVWAYNHGKPTLNKDLKELSLYYNVNSFWIVRPLPTPINQVTINGVLTKC